MKPAPFEYHRPASLVETFELLDRYGEDGRLLAGGQSLVPALNLRLATPRAVIDINRIPDLDAIRVTGEGLVIGALVRQEALERSPLVRAHAPLIAAAVPHVGHAAIRARGTIGGSLALADPAAELPACAIALGATIRAARRGGARAIGADEFFRGIYATALVPGEIVTEILVPSAAPGWRWGFEELARRHGDFALAGLAAGIRLAGGDAAVAARGAAEGEPGEYEEARLVFFGVGPRPVRARRAEAALVGRRADAEALGAAGRALEDDLDPPGDVHGSPALRRHLARVLLARVVGRLVEARA
ncbi:MAG TPA: xanthine dehydrogenase family protein subunit M [Methylomirabilota bacterium]|nr:xanthine dehydrogenase family protein subunit M [Methylomirabilota bacterium]